MAAQYYKMIQYLKAHFEVPDVRTPEQIARAQAASAEREQRRWGKGVRRWINKRAYHLYRHLERFLAKRGCVPETERPVKLYRDRGERRRSLKEPDISFLPRDEAARQMMYDCL